MVEDDEVLAVFVGDNSSSGCDAGEFGAELFECVLLVGRGDV